MSDLRRLLRYAGRYKGLVALGLSCSLIASVLLGGFVWLTKPVTEEILLAGGGEPGESPVDADEPEASDPKPRLETIGRLESWADGIVAPVRAFLGERAYLRLPVVIVLLFLIRGAFGYAAEYSLRKMGLRLITDVRRDLYGRVVRQSDSFFRRHSTGLLMSRIMGDVGRLQRILASDFGHSLRVVGNMLVALVLAFYHSWPLTVLVLGAMPLVAAPVARFGRRVKRMSTRSQERAAEISSVLSETIRGNRVVQSFGMEDFEVRRFSRGLDRMLSVDLKAARATALSPAVVELIGSVFSAGVVAFAGYRISSGRLASGDLIVVLISLGLIFTGVRRLSSMNNNLQRALAAARRVFSMMDTPCEVQERPEARRLEPLGRELRFEQVSFGYGDLPVLADVDLTVRVGEVHALVGPSGAGKTTLVSLVPRFYDPSAGRVTLDGVDLSEGTLRSLREQVALVTQETVLFDASVRNNIAYGRGDVTDEAVRAAAQAANAHEFIADLPEDYETVIGEGGTRLSAGQRQRLAIARALLKNAPILILDEATSALDTESEALVQEALDRLIEGRTVLVIAHRLSTVRRATRIHVLEAGRIVESGTHEDLLARGGLYARLHALQFDLDGQSRSAAARPAGPETV